MSQPVLIMAGGTGGHIFPGLAVAQELRERGVPIVWLGASNGMEERLVPAHGFAFQTIDFSGVRGKGLATLLLTPLRLLRAVLQARKLLRKHAPRSVLSMGGYVAAPGGIAARLAGIPLIVHEQNSVPGMSNRLLSVFARRILTGFPDAFHGAKAEWVGNPVRRSIAAIAEPARRYAERSGAIRLLVIGGSLGAQTLNSQVPLALATLDQNRYEVRHQCGARQTDAVQAAYDASGVRATVVSFIDDMADAYAHADLVICRAGALTIAELASAGLPSILIPYPLAVDDHQTHNAAALVDKKAARLLADGDVDATRLGALIAELSVDREQLRVMADAARSLARPGAIARIADCCLEATP